MNSRKGFMMFLAALFGFVILGVLLTVWQYNQMRSSGLEADNAWSRAEIIYQERFDFIPKIVQTVVAQTEQERQVLLYLADTRSRYLAAKTTDEKIVAAADFDKGVSNLFPVILQDGYPNIKFAEAFKDLKTSYDGQESRLRPERNRYNEAVTSYNKAVKTFPGNFFAGLFGFKERMLFEIADSTETVPDLNSNVE